MSEHINDQENVNTQ